MTEINLFNYETIDEAKKQEALNETIAKKDELTPCIKCHVLPVMSIHTKGKLMGYTYIECPVCKFACGTHYDPIEHWNKCNQLKMRRKEFEK